MLEALIPIAVIPLCLFAIVAGAGFGIAAVMREKSRGKIALLRAERGEPEPPTYIFTLSRDK